MRRGIFAFLIVSLALAAACGRSGSAAADERSWCRLQSFEGSRFTVCDNQGGRLQLFAAARNEAPLRSFADVARHVDSSNVAFAMNGGMFDQNGRPIGLAIVGPGHLVHAINLRDGPGNFHMKPNGVFEVDTTGKASIFESAPMSSEVVRDVRVTLATQSGPLLVEHDKMHPKIQPDGESRLIRNAVGVTSAGKPLFVISEDPVSLGKLARFMRDQLHTPDALFLDGSVSALWDPADNREDASTELGPIIVAFKPAASAPGRAGRARP
jgi:uncharacterized protein YigE (DUF2233 family)